MPRSLRLFFSLDRKTKTCPFVIQTIIIVPREKIRKKFDKSDFLWYNNIQIVLASRETTPPCHKNDV